MCNGNGGKLSQRSLDSGDSAGSADILSCVNDVLFHQVAQIPELAPIYDLYAAHNQPGSDLRRYLVTFVLRQKSEECWLHLGVHGTQLSVHLSLCSELGSQLQILEDCRKALPVPSEHY